MVSQSNLELKNILKTLVPIGNLSKDDIELIAASSTLSKFNSNYIIFNEGDSDEYAYYLLEGELELISTDNTNFHIVADTDDACYPLAQFQPRQYTAKTIVDSLILIVDRTLLDSLLVGQKANDSNAGVEVNELGNDDTDDWMTRILRSPLYTSISVENIQKIFSRIESIDVKKGDVIINQGDSGDYYYIIQIGRCQISRKPTPTSQDIKLAQLREGDAFGEEAIIAETKRNASVTMITDGRLMRLNKNDFIELILESILNKVDMDTAEDFVSKGGVWLDVRYPDEFQDYAIEGSMNIPLNLLRLQVGKLSNTLEYIVCCDTGSRSSIAAFILAQNGYNVFQLSNGLKDIFRHEDVNKVNKTEIESVDSANILPFIKDNNTESNQHVLNTVFHDEMNELRRELDIVRQQFKELMHIKDIASDLKKSVIDTTDERLKAQRERINLQTQNANKLIQQAQKMKNELEEEKRLIHNKVEEHRLEQDKAISKIHEEINKRLLEEEKKMQAFYSWKASEIEKIKKFKQAAEKKYNAKTIERGIEQKGNDVLEQFHELESIKKEVQEHQKQEEELNHDLKEWLAEQVKNELSPLNREIELAKRKLLKEANVRAEKTRVRSKVHDLTLSSEIDTLLNGSNK